jgi:deoxyribodipyrimidine photolyase
MRFSCRYVWKHRVGINRWVRRPCSHFADPGSKLILQYLNVNRWNFLLESMSDLSSSLTELNPKQKLLVLRGSPEKVSPVVWKEWGITHLVFEKVNDASQQRAIKY